MNFYFLLFAFTSFAQAPIRDTAANDTLHLAVVGDLMCHVSQIKAAQKDSVTYNFHPSFQAVKPYLEEADIAIGNLETVTAGIDQKYTGYPQFNTPVEFLDAIQEAGLDVLATANNHSLDRRFIGVERTIAELDKRGLMHTGTFTSQEERDKILIIDQKNIRLALLAYTYGTNGIPLPEGKKFCVNLIDTVQMKADIKRAREIGCDQIAVFIHWGDEYQRQPNSRQIAIAQFLRKEGVNLVLGSHPHVLQPMERSMHTDSSFFVVYSMGNFISGQRKQYTESGVIVRIRLIKNRDTHAVRLDHVDYIPTYVSTQNGYTVIPVQDAIYAVEKGQKELSCYRPMELARLRAVWQETTQHLSGVLRTILPYVTTSQ